jgi:hypothetical protein
MSFSVLLPTCTSLSYTYGYWEKKIVKFSLKFCIFALIFPYYIMNKTKSSFQVCNFAK